MSDAATPEGAGRRALRAALVLLYGAVGIAHLAVPDTLVRIVPTWVPEPHRVVLVTGLCELAGAAALAGRRWRGAAGIGLALYAACVYPANVRHAFEGIVIAGIPDSWWYHGPRLAFQPVLVWAALYAGRVTDWPFRPTGFPKG